jgi:hypothetical protein
LPPKPGWEETNIYGLKKKIKKDKGKKKIRGIKR